jgi:ACT domain-containing protein
MGQRAVVTVMGQDKVGIVAGITSALAEANVNIIDISQTLLQDIFAMLLMVELSDNTDLTVLHDQLEAKGQEIGVKIMVQHEDVFRYMHRI